METLVVALAGRGIQVKVLTTVGKGDFHKTLEKKGIETFTLNQTRIIPAVVGFILFCKKHKIRAVHAHLQAANIIAVLAQYFIKAKVIVFRHHFELPVPGMQRNQNEVRGEKLVNRLAKKIIVPSSGVYDGMMNYERVDMKKVNISKK